MYVTEWDVLSLGGGYRLIARQVSIAKFAVISFLMATEVVANAWQGGLPVAVRTYQSPKTLASQIVPH